VRIDVGAGQDTVLNAGQKPVGVGLAVARFLRWRPASSRHRACHRTLPLRVCRSTLDIARFLPDATTSGFLDQGRRNLGHRHAVAPHLTDGEPKLEQVLSE
jgi:hypothetical protein